MSVGAGSLGAMQGPSCLLQLHPRGFLGSFFLSLSPRFSFLSFPPLLLSLLADFPPTFKKKGENLERGQWGRTVNVGAWRDIPGP